MALSGLFQVGVRWGPTGALVSAARGEAVAVRRPRLRVTRAAHRWPEIVGYDEEAVGARSGGGKGRNGQCGRQE